MKYKELIKRLQPYADKEVIIFANYLEAYDEVGFYADPDGEPICIVSQEEGQKAQFQKE